MVKPYIKKYRHDSDVGIPSGHPTIGIPDAAVTAQIWYPKIWAKFSLFLSHDCIMASIFKLLHMK